MDKIKALLVAFLSKTLNMDEAGVTALLNADGTEFVDGALEALLQKDADRVKLLTKGKGDEEHKRAKREARTEFEKEIKAKFGITSEKFGTELVEELIASKTAAAGEITEEQVKKSKWYLDLNESVKGKVDDAVAAAKKEFDEFKKGISRKETLSAVQKKALEIFEGLNPVLSTDAKRAANQRQMFLAQFENGNYRIDGDNIIILDKDGNDLQDSHGNRVNFAASVKEKAESSYDFKKAEDRSSAGGAGSGAGGGTGTVFIAKTKEELAEYQLKETDQGKRAAASKAFSDSQKAAQTTT